MKTRTKIYLIIGGIIAVICIAFVVWGYLNYGAIGAAGAFFVLIIILAFLLFMYSEARRSRPKIDRDRLDQIEREAHAKKWGEIRAQKDAERRQQEIDNYRRRQEEVDNFMLEGIGITRKKRRRKR